MFFRESRKVMRLDTPYDVVKLSYLVQKSICYLDLSLCEYSSNTRLLNTKEAFVNAVEKEREKTRYALNLDAASALDKMVFLERAPDFYFLRGRYHVIDIWISPAVYSRHLIKHMLTVIGKSNDKLKFLRNYLEAHDFYKKLFTHFEITNISECFRMFLMEECNDSSLIVNFLRVSAEFIRHTLLEDDIRCLEYLIIHSHKMNFNLFDVCSFLLDGPFLYCLGINSYKSLKILSKYGYGPQFQLGLSTYFPSSYEFLDGEPVECSPSIIGEHFLRRRRIFLRILLQLYKHKEDQKNVADAIRLIFKSIPDSFLSREEILMMFEDKKSYLFYLTGVWKFYKAAFRNYRHFHTRQPRALAHYCRCTIRKALNVNRALPDGIESIGLPPTLKSYLNLEY